MLHSFSKFFSIQENVSVCQFLVIIEGVVIGTTIYIDVQQTKPVIINIL